jgi:hypothetical protein
LDAIIRNLNAKTYREFKSRAARAGLKVGEALKLAMEAWVASNENAVPLDSNDQAFKRLRSELQKRYYGKHIAIANAQLAAVADTYERLIAELRRKKIGRCLTVQMGVDETGEGGEWLWSSIGQETA